MIGSYLRQRFGVAMFVPLAAAVAILASGGTSDAATLGGNALTALLLLAEFRLWDDLADLRTDALTHPRRVLVNAPSVRPFKMLVAGLLLVNLAICLAVGTRVSFATFVALHGALGAWYVRRSRRTILGDQLLLAKYPAFVVIVAGPRAAEAPMATAAGALAIYVAASLYEAWHDPASPVSMLLGGRS